MKIVMASKYFHTVALTLLIGAMILPKLPAQTILSGDHVIEGDLSVDNDVLTGGSLVVAGDNGVVFRGTGPTTSSSFPSNNSITPGPGEALALTGDVLVWDPAKGALRFGRLSSGGTGGYWSTAWGYSTVADGLLSTAWGQWTMATGQQSTAWGAMNIASGDYSTAWGYMTSATGRGSTAWGSGTDALGAYATAWGVYAFADSFASTALGRYNIAGGDPLVWIDTDPLFEIGNGDASLKHNAITVLKNGRTTIGNKYWDEGEPTAIPATTNTSSGEALVVDGHTRLRGRVIIEQPQGDIPMGVFTARTIGDS